MTAPSENTAPGSQGGAVTAAYQVVDGSPTRRRRFALLVLVLAIAGTLSALAITPGVTVRAFGQQLTVGAVPPSADLGLSGPAQADLFGEGSVDTVLRFDGPVRPKIVWQRFERNAEAAEFVQASAAQGQRDATTGVGLAGRALAEGWVRYFIRLVVVAGAISGALYLVVLGALSLLVTRQRPRGSPRQRLTRLLACIVAGALLTTAFSMLTVVSAVDQLRQVTSLSDLVGTARLAPLPTPVGVSRTDADVVVLGDSTAAGIGNAPLPAPTQKDDACRRSRDAYAGALQSASGMRVLNLACSGATIASGLLGPQVAGGQTIDAQVGVLRSIPSARLVIVSIGANDVGWADFLSYCYGLPRCDDQISDSLFQSRLDSFRLQYGQLLQQLTALPWHPEVLVNAYYDPFGDRFDCSALADPDAAGARPAGYGFAADPGQDNQAEKVRQKIDPLRAELAGLNGVLEAGAEAFGFGVARPDFSGHGLCTEQSWVQGLSDPAPFHPRAAGELAIAAADLPTLATMVTR